MTKIFHWFFMWKMDPMSGCDIRLMFTLPPRDSTLQYKRWVHLWNNFPCIITLQQGMYNSTCSMSQPFFRRSTHFYLALSLGAKYIQNRICIRGEFKESLGMNFIIPFQPERECTNHVNVHKLYAVEYINTICSLDYPFQFWIV